MEAATLGDLRRVESLKGKKLQKKVTFKKDGSLQV